jgi:hypothetical protein
MPQDAAVRSFFAPKSVPSLETHRYVLRVVPVLYTLKLHESNSFASHADVENIERNQWLDIDQIPAEQVLYIFGSIN